MNKRIMYISSHTKPGFEKNDLYFIKYLKKKIDIDFFAISDNGISGNYTYNKKYKRDKDFLLAKTIWKKSRWEIFYNILKHDIIIISSLDGASDYVIFCKKLSKKVIIIDSFFNQDYDPKIFPDLFIFKGKNAHKTFSRLTQKKKFNYENCGCIQSIFIKKNKISKKEFIKKYKLRYKKSFVFFPHGPQYFFDKFYINSFLDIINVIKKNKYNLLIHPHPTFSNRLKNKKFKNNKIRQIINEHKIDSKDLYNSINYAEAGIAISSNVFQQVNLMNKPIIFVNRQKFYAINKKLINDMNYQKIKIYKFNVDNKLKTFEKDSEMVVTQLWKDHIRYYGVDASTKNLSYYINNISKLKQEYRINNSFKKNISRFTDLKCYSKSADVIYKFIEKSRIVKKRPLKFNYYKILLKTIIKIYYIKLLIFRP